MNSQFAEIEAKKIGKAIKIQREICEHTIDEVAAYLGISSEDLLKFEDGEVTPSLPQMESLAHLFGIPLEDLLASNESSQSQETISSDKMPAVIALRNRIIAVMIKRARLEQNRSSTEIADQINLDSSTLETYESGKVSIPLIHLAEICKTLDIPLSSLESGISPKKIQEETQQSAPEPKAESAPENIIPSLPPELYEFISNNSNLPYILLAKRLSEMEAAKLRRIAESLLEITY